LDLNHGSEDPPLRQRCSLLQGLKPICFWATQMAELKL
jgi:hypothetical protein